MNILIIYVSVINFKGFSKNKISIGFCLKSIVTFICIENGSRLYTFVYICGTEKLV